MKPGQNRRGTAIDFDHARADFETAWQRVLPTLTDANFQEWREQRDWIEEVRDVGTRRTVPFPESEQHDGMPLRREIRQLTIRAAAISTAVTFTQLNRLEGCTDGRVLEERS
jgi:hypothetical protein